MKQPYMFDIQRQESNASLQVLASGVNDVELESLLSPHAFPMAAERRRV